MKKIHKYSGRNSLHYNSRFAKHLALNLQINIIEFLLNFHACPISTSLKGATLEVISSVAESPELVLSVWYSLQQANVLEGLQPSRSNKSGNDIGRADIYGHFFTAAQDSTRRAAGA